MAQSTARSRRVLFIHVPKTGGSTVKSLLAGAIGDVFMQANSVEQLQRGEALVGPVHHLDDIRRVLAAHQGLALHVDASFDTVRRTTDFRSLAHYVFDPAHRASFDGVAILTMFRHPFRRWLSDYGFVRRMKMADPAFLPDLDLTTPEAYLRESHPNALLHFLLERDLHRRRTMTRDDVEHVKRCIAEYPIHVGIQERFDESVACFGRVLGLDLRPDAVPPQNVTAAPPDADPTLEVAFNARSPLDLELYDYACRLFDARSKMASSTIGDGW